MQVLVGIILALFGFFFVAKSDMMYNVFGAIPMAEKYLGTSGGSRFFYKLLGLLFIFVGFMIMFNLHLGIVEWIGKTFFGAYAPPPEDAVKKSLEPEF